MFVADALGLDILNTRAAPWGAEIEWLADGRGFLAWLEQAGVVPADVARAMGADEVLGELDAVAAQARTLREWFRGFVLAHAGRPITPGALADLEPLNRLLERDEVYGAVVPSDVGGPAQDGPDAAEPTPALQRRWLRRWRTPDTLLAPVAQAMADLVCEADFTQVKACEGAGCTLLFLDTSHRHARRWCSMAVCGNRAKQAKHRTRVKAVSGH